MSSFSRKLAQASSASVLLMTLPRASAGFFGTSSAKSKSLKNFVKEQLKKVDNGENWTTEVTVKELFSQHSEELNFNRIMQVLLTHREGVELGLGTAYSAPWRNMCSVLREADKDMWQRLFEDSLDVNCENVGGTITKIMKIRQWVLPYIIKCPGLKIDVAWQQTEPASKFTSIRRYLYRVLDWDLDDSVFQAMAENNKKVFVLSFLEASEKLETSSAAAANKHIWAYLGFGGVYGSSAEFTLRVIQSSPGLLPFILESTSEEAITIFWKEFEPKMREIFAGPTPEEGLFVEKMPNLPLIVLKNAQMKVLAETDEYDADPVNTLVDYARNTGELKREMAYKVTFNGESFTVRNQAKTQSPEMAKKWEKAVEEKWTKLEEKIEDLEREDMEYCGMRVSYQNNGDKGERIKRIADNLRSIKATLSQWGQGDTEKTALNEDYYNRLRKLYD